MAVQSLLSKARVQYYFEDFKPAIETLDLLRPIYRPTAAYGHFGRTEKGSFTWEKTDRAAELKDRLLGGTVAGPKATKAEAKAEPKKAAKKAAKKS